jgi:hypothetical protein
MPGLWSAQRVFEKIRRLSDLLSYVCIPGKTARRGKIKLVSWPLAAGYWLLVAGRWSLDNGDFERNLILVLIVDSLRT